MAMAKLVAGCSQLRPDNYKIKQALCGKAMYRV